jgi:LPS O-antigen subunit length determinant protein (WzzB/FepE family)
VLHQSALRKLLEPEAREVLEQEYRRERERLTSERDRKIEKIRGT